MKRFIAVAVALAVIAAPSAALAGKKKKKGPKPYTSEVVSVTAGHPVFSSASGTLVSLTAQEFINSCAIPSSNGVDGYVFEVPAEYQKIQAEFEVVGTGAVAPYDVDVYTFDSSCAQTLAANTAGTDQGGVIFKGTAYMFVHNYEPGPLDIQLTLKP